MMSRTGWPIVGQSCGLVSRGEGLTINISATAQSVGMGLPL
ncbi:Uncharacterised protein [Mycobacteroides abscessus]|nr:Uncharacterised protein [Mycobacteroides abscessus]